jgi:hypothetical protein
MRTSALTILALAALPFATFADETQPVKLTCSPQPPLICASFSTTTPGRFDPLMQQWMVRQQLDGQAKNWGVIFLYVPNVDVRTLEELQIRFLDELLSRQKSTGDRP